VLGTQRCACHRLDEVDEGQGLESWWRVVKYPWT